ncbi:phosphatase PAP2 family protein [Streptomyces sp. CWNU-1]|uniref:Phosphatase PAP2 family protein n=2 Tax=Streptomyces albipurpureus TaxID=2897419 RepID=A0ABT0UL81_9ACTN|nr:phosphatase PAP2 family protein [Streptomyces sp. CWNU-1]MCM2389362.1 phosphatase PAP2 family protein [Streptomyces sp. CWNU-1]
MARDCGGQRGIAAAAQALSFAGEHGALWLAAGLAGAASDGERRGAWLRATTVVGGAHLMGMGMKRVVRRARPATGAAPHPGSPPEQALRPPLVNTLGRYSFPSCHAASAAAAVVAFGALLPSGGRLLPSIAAAMCVSRLVVGVHYPTDIAAGAALGGLAARLGRRWMIRPLATLGTRGGERGD